MAVTALYLRISVDDDNLTESDSIIGQRDMLQAYAAADPALSSGEVLIFADDGWSGTNFERPQVKALLDLARRGGVQTILVKDLSRWGRNYPEVSEYLDQIFPFLGVRFISLGEGYDSAAHKGQTAPMSVAFATIVHHVYAEEQSFKVSQSYKSRTQKGEYLCGSVPFGFVKSTVEKNKLVIDADAAEIVRRVFSLTCEGLLMTQTAAAMNESGFDTPSDYRKRCNGISPDNEKLNQFFWTGSTVAKILRNEIYKGVLVGGKMKTATPGGRKRINMPESEWIRINSACEAIVSGELFDKANATVRRLKKTAVERKPSLFSLFAGKLKCGFCGMSLKMSTTKNVYYYCKNARVNSGKGCSDSKLYHAALSELVLATVKMEASKTLGTREKARQLNTSKSREASIAELKRLDSHITALERKNISLYEDFADGKLDRDAYLTAKTESSTEFEKAQARRGVLTSQLEELAALHNDADGKYNSMLHRVLNAGELTAEIMTLVDRILFYNEERVEIKLTFGDTNISF